MISKQRIRTNSGTRGHVHLHIFHRKHDISYFVPSVSKVVSLQGNRSQNGPEKPAIGVRAGSWAISAMTAPCQLLVSEHSLRTRETKLGFHGTRGTAGKATVTPKAEAPLLSLPVPFRASWRETGPSHRKGEDGCCEPRQSLMGRREVPT